MDYDLNQMRWEESNFSLFDYVPWRTGHASKETSLILNFKKNSNYSASYNKHALLETTS